MIILGTERLCCKPHVAVCSLSKHFWILKKEVLVFIGKVTAPILTIFVIGYLQSALFMSIFRAGWHQRPGLWG